MKYLIDLWKTLSTPIYVGKRLKNNLIALTAVSVFTAILGFVLIIIDIVTGKWSMLIPSIATFLGGAGCGILAGVFKKREIAIIIPTIFCAVAFTYYAITGAADGTAILWSFLLPIGLCYFVSVKYGILLSVYYIAFFSVIFFTPVKDLLPVGVYTPIFMLRFPIMFASIAIFTAIAMIQYHRTALFEIEHTNKLNEEVEKQTKIARDRADRLEELNEETIFMLAQVIDAKDKYTNGHSLRVAKYAVALAEKLGYGDDEVSALRREALLHDIGKIGVPDQVLNKPGRLTPEEFDVIKSHTTIGGNILSEAKELLSASETARYHHERYDGKGYPSGLSGTDIPVNARIVSIADAYDAMHSDRIYRKGLPLDIIRGELVAGRGTQFDPEFLDAFLELFDCGALNGIE